MLLISSILDRLKQRKKLFKFTNTAIQFNRELFKLLLVKIIRNLKANGRQFNNTCFIICK